MLDVGINAAPLAAARTGVGRYISGLLDALTALRPDGIRARALFAPRDATRRVRGLVKRLPYAYDLADLSRAALLLRERPDVFHETNHAAPPFRGPVVLTVHDLSTLLHPQTQEPARALHFGRALLRRARRAARVIVPTGAIAIEVREHLRVEPARIRVIHHGLDARFTRGGCARGRFVLFAGDAGARKGLDLLEAALPEGADLIAVGPGNRYVSDEVLVQLYRTAAVVAVPSRYEGFGLSVIEAMGCGAPCIASDDPALVEVSGGAALHFPRGDALALRDQLRRVLQEPSLREELSERGLARAREFRWEESARLHAETYREAAG